MDKVQTEKNHKALDLIKASLWGTEVSGIDWDVYDIIRKHGLLMLPNAVLADMAMPDDLRNRWEKDILQQFYYSSRYVYFQSELPVSVPYVILKGTSAAQYYPHPEYRCMGDIDIMTRREDFDKACEMLLDDGFQEEAPNNRHREFAKDGIPVEVHRSFAYVDDIRQARTIDSIILKNIPRSRDHKLPDLVNGLVLLEHVNHHMEHGLGLRQIIDWMMFAHCCLSEEQWKEFSGLAEQVGLNALAVALTRMCELYLGLSEHSWCHGADVTLCSDLMEYLLSSGNFGRDMQFDERRAVARGEWLRHPAALLRQLQKEGVENWDASANPMLRPFAWIWQSVHLAGGNRGLIGGIIESSRRDRMFKALGVKRKKNGMVYYKDGEYFKRRGTFDNQMDREM